MKSKDFIDHLVSEGLSEKEATYFIRKSVNGSFNLKPGSYELFKAIPGLMIQNKLTEDMLIEALEENPINGLACLFSYVPFWSKIANVQKVLSRLNLNDVREGTLNVIATYIDYVEKHSFFPHWYGVLEDRELPLLYTNPTKKIKELEEALLEISPGIESKIARTVRRVKRPKGICSDMETRFKEKFPNDGWFIYENSSPIGFMKGGDHNSIMGLKNIPGSMVMGGTYLTSEEAQEAIKENRPLNDLPLKPIRMLYHTVEEIETNVKF